MNLKESSQEVSKKLEKALSKIAVFFIAAYRVILSPWMGGSCRFYPSCSEYSLNAFSQHGFLRGLQLTVRRVLRCRPGGGHGYDPVPDISEKHLVEKGKVYGT